MKVRCAPRLRPDFINHSHGKKIVFEADIRILDGSRLAAKFLLFKTKKDLHSFWLKALGTDITGALGAVNGLHTEIYDYKNGKEDHYVRVDPKYFCIIGLCQEHLSMEVICHESVHAGIAYQKRAKRKFWIAACELDEELICYPSGRIAGAINAILLCEDLYP